MYIILIECISNSFQKMKWILTNNMYACRIERYNAELTIHNWLLFEYNTIKHQLYKPTALC